MTDSDFDNMLNDINVVGEAVPSDDGIVEAPTKEVQVDAQIEEKPSEMSKTSGKGE